MLKKFIASIMIFVMLLGVCACSSSPSQTLEPSPSATSQPTPSPEPTPKSDLTLSDFTIIYPSDDIEGVMPKTLAMDLRIYMSTQLSVGCSMYNDEIDPDNGMVEHTYEILIGNTNRIETTQAFEKSNLHYYDYVIKYVGTKLVIRAGSDEALGNAVDYFKNNLLNKSFTTVEGCKELTQIDYQYIYQPKIKNFTVNGTYISNFKVVSKRDNNEVNDFMQEILESTGEKLARGTEGGGINEFEILYGDCDRDEYKQVYNTLGEYDYAVEVVNNKVVIAGKNDAGFKQAVNKFIWGYLNMSTDEFDLNKDNDYHYVDVYEDRIITVDGIALRDPCVILHDGVYYMYGTWWQCYKNTTGNLQSGWEKVNDVVVFPEDAYTDYWAPEVHEYKGKFYMFTTYRSSKNDKRGCAIFRANSPEGPFELISDGHVTPSDRNCIDGTLYVDENGQPWMMFVLEWVDTGMGGMACAKLSDDLTHFISEPVKLFDADAPEWTSHYVTDGPWLYKCEDGGLLMIWSNNGANGYSVGIAHSQTGLITGPWEQEKDVFFPVGNHTKYDGGHGMIFYDIDGNMWMSIHSPNSAQTNRPETPVFIPIREENGTLVFDDRVR